MIEPTVEVRQFIERRPRERHPYGVAFMMLSQRGVGELNRRLADRTITMVGMRVLLAMLERMDFENRVDEAQKELAVELGLAPSDLSRACRLLLECGFLERMGNRRGWYRVSPRLCWKGNVKSLKDAIEARA